ncbi:cyclic pyranopterin monophosphate synthase accessory protein [Weizmannia acidilactici]|uniref:Cyclic pyranopterin monophosphate synthase n=1 Tax=Weizmannia acidilactici TaxID=2607726 RepID=A0A5J4JGG9_9BACI|nr:cyclic pyranopterin monophosphate synthase MoaC [Weizmannia acidilactici]GER66426.1 cyclic pyranopterin monophosphate synthase accessory protein [Weizmannia acidilactici]GER69428.1 cyclic pyranopterin monophosphate synthase accessory protein [Weizmannia acidilactici]GER72244.1 cyclic pyranopterin monophosphate synthase accessory protein [Weizmannia acidilactici]
MEKLTHMNEQGRAKMVDVTEKQETVRTAHAKSCVVLSKEVYENIIQLKMKKGDVLAVAQVAGIMGAKKTADVIPMCHPLSLTGVDISFSWQECEDGQYALEIDTYVKTKGSTGVEMEALTAASICALTVYDMCKAVDKSIVIGPTYLIEKTGGKSGHFKRQEE